MPRSNFLRSCIAALALFATTSAANAEPAMWVVKDDNSTIYLLGTIHILRPDTVWQTPKIKSAVAKQGVKAERY